MGHRLSKITTKTGDAGTTGLGDGSRVPKTHPRIVAIGEVDELNSVLGVLLCESISKNLAVALVTIQHDLFDLGGELSIPGFTAITDVHIERLEAWIEAWNADLPMLKDFILPGGSRAAAQAHMLRTVGRRAERSLWLLSDEDASLSLLSRVYLNRLSDLAFILARILNKEAGIADVLWQKERAAITK